MLSLDALKEHAKVLGYSLRKTPVPPLEKKEKVPSFKSQVKELVLEKGKATEKVSALKDLLGLKYKREIKKVEDEKE